MCLYLSTKVSTSVYIYPWRYSHVSLTGSYLLFHSAFVIVTQTVIARIIFSNICIDVIYQTTKEVIMMMSSFFMGGKGIVYPYDRISRVPNTLQWQLRDVNDSTTCARSSVFLHSLFHDCTVFKDHVPMRGNETTVTNRFDEYNIRQIRYERSNALIIA